MTDKIKKDGTFAALKGFHKAVPFLIGIISVYIGVCFITDSTGAFGRWLSASLLGLFSTGAYFIPLLMIFHACFYARDLHKNTLIFRIALSLASVIMIGALAHISNLGVIGFEPKLFFQNGKTGEGGGFIGGILAYGVAKIIGSAGVIILAVLTLAFYLGYFFISGKSFFAGLALVILTFISDSYAKRQATREKRLAMEAEQRKRDEHERRGNLLDDEFFSSASSLSTLNIPALGIKEVNSSAISPPSESNEIAPIEEDKTDKRELSKFDYGIDTPLPAPSLSAAPAAAPTSTDKSERSERAAYGLDENADDVFNDKFSGFDFKINEELAYKPSSRANEAKKSEPVSEIATPVYTVSAEEVEKARQRADFEMKKKAALEAQEEINRISKSLPEEQTLEFGERPVELSVKEESEEPVNEPILNADELCCGKDVQIPQSKEAPVIEETPIIEETPVIEEAPAVEEAPAIEEIPAVEEAPAIEEIPAVEEAPAIEEIPAVEEAPAIEEIPAVEESPVIEEIPVIEETAESEPEQISPYSDDKYDSIVREILNVPEAPTIVMQREVLEPDVSLDAYDTESEDTDESESFVFAAPDGTESYAEDIAESPVFSYGEDDDEEAEEAEQEELTAPPADQEEDTDSYYEEIPPEEQNPKISEYRKMFSFLEEDDNSQEEELTETESISDLESVSDTDIVIESPENEGEQEEENGVPFEFDIKERKPIFDIPSPKKPEKKEEAQQEKPDYSNYKFPPIDLLHVGQVEEDVNSDEETKENAEKLVETLAQFSVKVSLKGYDRGPRITRYEIVPAKGVKVNQVTNLFDDIALSMAADGIRMEAPIPGKSAIGVEIPNKKPSLVFLRDLIETDDFEREESKTCAAIGKDVTGNPVFGDISKMPHVLIAGATGMGKSVCINAVLISILYKARPDEVKFIMIDPKRVEFNSYNGIPHLLIPVVTEVKQAAGALMWAVEQMEKRYDLMGALEVKKLDEYNELVRENPSLGEPLPKIIIVIDELNDIMLQARKPVEGLIMSIAQKARAAGIHLILGTQRPSVDVITGVIKSNIPSRISCKVMSFQDSKTIIDQAGAEKLLNNGDMLYFPNGSPKPLRVQGAYVSNSEVSQIMRFLKDQTKGMNIYDQKALDEINNAAKKCVKGGAADDDGGDEGQEENAGILNDQQFLDAVDLAIKSGKISTSLIQRRIGVGYGKAAKFIDYMEDFGIVSEPNGQKPRDILIDRDAWHEMLARRAMD